MKLRIATVLLLALLVVGCRGKQNVLRMVVIPADDEVSTRERYQPFVDYIAEGMRMDVELITATDYTAVVEAMKYEHADVARFGPLSYVMATEETEIDVLVTAVKKASGQPNYRALIISRPDLQSLEGASFAYVDPGSTSGYGVPSLYIADNDIQLGQVVLAGSHPAVIEAVRNGSVDAGAIADNRWYTALEEGVIAEGELKIFYESELIPNSPWAVRSAMDDKLKQQLRNVMLDMPEDIVYSLGISETGFVAASDSDYEIIRRVWESMN